MPLVKNYKGKFMHSLKDGIVGGIAGGVPIGILFQITKTPIIASTLGSAIGSAFVSDDTTRKIIVVNGFMDGIVSLMTVGR
jgi:hypothetical protein